MKIPIIIRIYFYIFKVWQHRCHCHRNQHSFASNPTPLQIEADNNLSPNEWLKRQIFAAIKRRIIWWWKWNAWMRMPLNCLCYHVSMSLSLACLLARSLSLPRSLCSVFLFKTFQINEKKNNQSMFFVVTNQDDIDVCWFSILIEISVQVAKFCANKVCHPRIISRK